MGFVNIDKHVKNGEYCMQNMQSHSYYEIYFLSQGKRNIFIENKAFTLSENTFIVIPPFTVHRTEGSSFTRYNMYISPALLDSQNAEFLATHSKKIYKPESELCELIKKMFETVIKKDFVSPTDREKYFVSVINTMLYLYASKPLENVDSEFDPKTDIPHKVINYINDNYVFDTTLKSLCEKFYVSRTALCRDFKKTFNFTVIGYVQYKKINASKKLLLTTNKSVEEISAICGFSSANYFSLIFKKNVGLSPLNYRKLK